MFHKEGYKIILISFTLVVVSILLVDSFITISWLKLILEIGLLIFLVLILQFFRNPKRHTQLNDSQVVSPVDGKVVVIEEVEETEFFNDKRIQVSVFMSPIIKLDVNPTSTPLGANKISLIACANWLTLNTGSAPIIQQKLNIIAKGFQFFPKPSIMKYIGPPCNSPALSFPLNIIARVDVKNLVDIPTTALIHIQNTAPGPPIEIATATPATLPIPIVDDNAVVNA